MQKCTLFILHAREKGTIQLLAGGQMKKGKQRPMKEEATISKGENGAFYLIGE